MHWIPVLHPAATDRIFLMILPGNDVIYGRVDNVRSKGLYAFKYWTEIRDPN
ncbi:hypothetical protein D1AOALGA4SA_5647 [Olavius algarvensis Delta 1 endosymbiont]|nr:hypothetical protein D1AOALGA4SA_5647 [Olavius algarvensis Delta 1 endosymbiont]